MATAPAPGAAASSAAGADAPANDALASDEEELNSDDDESDDDAGASLDPTSSAGGNGADEVDGDNTMLCQFDKVKRSRSGESTQWKVTLKGGVATINGKSYAFSHCEAEFGF